MPYTAPRTFVAGEIETAAIFNTYLRDNDLWVLTDSPSVHAYHNTTQSIPTGANTAVVLNSERFDNAAMHSTSSNTSRFTVPAGGAGKYLIGNNVEWQNATSGTYRDTEIRVNGTAYIASNTLSYPLNTLGNDAIRQSVVVVYSLAVGDYVETVVTQNTGGALTLTNGVGAPAFWAFWIRT